MLFNLLSFFLHRFMGRTVLFLKNKFLIYTKNKTVFHHHIELGLDDSDLNDFISLLHIDIKANEYKKQFLNIISLLKTQFNADSFEAEHYYYNNALKAIKDIAVNNDIRKRTISKDHFLTRIDKKEALFNSWFVQLKGKQKYYKNLRRQYFSNLNISPFERFFLIEVSGEYDKSELKDLIFAISKKWSKISLREANPYCPYLYIHNLSTSELIDLKQELHTEDFCFVDGYDFYGASFCCKSLTKRPDFNNKIRIKFLSQPDQINLVLTELTKTKEIYQFYMTDAFYDNSDFGIKHIKIQIEKLRDIKEII